MYKLQFAVTINKFNSIFAISINKDDRNLVIDEYISNDDSYTQSKRATTKQIYGAYNSGYALTKSEDLIFISGGFIPPNANYTLSGNEIQGPSNSIIIFNLRKMDFFECTIKCPFKGAMHAISMTNEHQDELLVFGFIHESYQNKEWNNILKLPIYLMKFVLKFIVTEYIHILGQYNRKHFKINVDHLLTSCPL